MKKLLLISMFFVFGMGFYACDPEPAPPVSDDLREEIDRKWFCELNDGQHTYSFESTISLDSENDNHILITNFSGLDAQAYAIVYDDYTIELPSQDLPGTSTNVEGTADINTDFTRIDWSYQVTDTEGAYSVTVAYTLSDITKNLQ